MSRRGWVKLGLAVVIGLACAVLAFRQPRKSEGLFLYCGAGIRPAADDIKGRYEAETGIPVQITYAGSGCLLSMLTFAKSGDLYMPGEQYYTDQARQAGHLTDEKIAAYFSAVVMVQKDNPKGIESLADLAREDVRVGIGHPDSVACGLIAKKILENAAVWEDVNTNIDAQGCYGGTAMELSNALVLNALDAAINWDAMAYPVRDKVEIMAIPREQNVEVPIPIGLLTFSKQPKAAREFTAYILSPAGQEAFRSHGYHTSPEPYVLPYYSTTALK